MWIFIAGISVVVFSNEPFYILTFSQNWTFEEFRCCMANGEIVLACTTNRITTLLSLLMWGDKISFFTPPASHTFGNRFHLNGDFSLSELGKKRGKSFYEVKYWILVSMKSPPLPTVAEILSFFCQKKIAKPKSFSPHPPPPRHCSLTQWASIFMWF